MSRDDGALYTGMTSTSLLSPKQVEVDKKRTEEATEREFERKQLAPFARIVSDAFDKEVDELRNIYYLNLDESLDPKDFKDAMLLNKRTIEAVIKVKRTIENKMRMR